MKRTFLTLFFAAAALTAVAQGPFSGRLKAFREWLAQQVVPADGTTDGLAVVSFRLEGGIVNDEMVCDATSEGLGQAVLDAVRMLSGISIVDGEGKHLNNVSVLAAYRLSGGGVEAVRLVEPSFGDGGKDAFRRWAMGKIYYRGSDMEPDKEIQAKVGYVVGRDGNVGQVEVLSTNSKGLAREVVRVVESSPAWTPATVDGQPVSVRYTLPVVMWVTQTVRRVD